MATQLERYSDKQKINPKTTIDGVLLKENSNKTLKDLFSDKVVTHKDIDVNITVGGWTRPDYAYSSCYKQISFPEISDSDNPIYNLKNESTATEAQLISFRNINSIKTYNGYIIIYCDAQPTVDFTLTFKNVGISLE